MLSASILLLTPLLAQCAPVVNRASSVSVFHAPSASSSPSIISSSSASTETGLASSSSSIATSISPLASVPSSSVVTATKENAFISTLPVSQTPEVDLVVNPEGAESVFVAPAAFNQSSPSTDDGRSSYGLGPFIMGYYPYWDAATLAPKDVPFDKYDWVYFAFAMPNEQAQLVFDDASCSALLQDLVEAGHANGKKVSLSIGGWGGSQHFSSAVSPENRMTFVNSVASVYNLYGLDGIDFDWEYPGREGNAGNEVNSEDSYNFLSFLQTLRSTLPDTALLSAAASDTPFTGSDGQPMDNVAPFAQVLDTVLLMIYDVNQASPTPGPNAPMLDNCGNSTQPEANAAAAVNSWTKAGFPVHQLTLGLPYYGYVSNSNATSLRARASSPSIRLYANGRADEGSISFNSMVEQGALAPRSSSPGSGQARAFDGSNGFSRRWDECSATPFLYSQASRQFVSYDDPESLRMKAAFVKKMGLFGVNVWSLTGDTPQHDLALAVAEGLCSE